jgi:hypothetical protein
MSDGIGIVQPFALLGVSYHLGGTVKSVLAMWRIGRVSVTTHGFVEAQLYRGS